MIQVGRSGFRVPKRSVNVFNLSHLSDRLCGQSSWLQIQRSVLNFRRHQIFWKVVGLERGPLSFVSTIEELHERKSSGSGLESWEYRSRDPSRWPHGTLYPQKLARSLTNGGRSVGIVLSRTQSMEFSLVLVLPNLSSSTRPCGLLSV
jgi:hypothetical protein